MTELEMQEYLERKEAEILRHVENINSLDEIDSRVVPLLLKIIVQQNYMILTVLNEVRLS